MTEAVKELETKEEAALVIAEPVRKRVLIVVPNTGWLQRDAVFALLNMLRDPRYLTEVMLPVARPSENNRSRAMLDAFKGNYDYMLMMDSDNPPHNCNPLDLVELGLDIVGCPTPVWHDGPAGHARGDMPFYYNAMEFVGLKDGRLHWSPLQYDSKKDEPLQEVDAVGAGCILLSKKVIEVMRHLRPWNRETDPAGVVTAGSDMMFCRKAKEAGFKVWAHYGYICNHFHELGFIEVIEAMRRQRNAGLEKGGKNG